MSITKQKAKYAFEYWDDNGDGRVSKGVVKDVLHTAGFGEKERKKIMKHLKHDGKRISWKEYSKAIKKYVTEENLEEKEKEELAPIVDNVVKEVMEEYQPILDKEESKPEEEEEAPVVDYVPKYALEEYKPPSPPEYDAETPAKTLREAMKGFGTNEKKIISVYCSATHSQRAAITSAYNRLFKRDLIKDLKDETGWDFEKALVYLATPILEAKAMYLRNAMNRVGTRERDLIDVLAFLTSEELKALKKMYALKYGKSGNKINYDKLLDDVLGDTSFNFKKALVGLLKIGRSNKSQEGSEKAAQDAEGLYKKGQAVIGTDEAYFTRLITRRSREHLQEVSKVYKEKYGKTLEEAIKSELSGDFGNLLVALVKSKKDYFVERIYKAMKGIGTDELGLIYSLISHEPEERKELAELYKKKYKADMVRDIKADTGSDFETLLVALVEGKI